MLRTIHAFVAGPAETFIAAELESTEGEALLLAQFFIKERLLLPVDSHLQLLLMAGNIVTLVLDLPLFFSQVHLEFPVVAQGLVYSICHFIEFGSKDFLVYTAFIFIKLL